MADIRWNFPNGINGDTLTPALAGADTVNFAGGLAVLSDMYPLGGVGPLSARFSLGSTGHLWVAREGLSSTSYAYDAYLYIPSTLGGRVYVAWAGLGAAGRSLGVMIGGGSNELELMDSTGRVWLNPASNPVPLSTWIRISVFGTCGAGSTGTGRISWYLGSDTVPQGDSGLLTNLVTQASVDRIRIGGKAASSGVSSGVIHVGSWAYNASATGLVSPVGSEGAGVGWRRRDAGAWIPTNTYVQKEGQWQTRSITLNR